MSDFIDFVVVFCVIGFIIVGGIGTIIKAIELDTGIDWFSKVLRGYHQGLSYNKQFIESFQRMAASVHGYVITDDAISISKLICKGITCQS